MLAPYAIQVILNEESHSFISAFITIFIGILFIQQTWKDLNLTLDKFLFSSMAWFTVPHLSLPYLLSTENFL